VALRTGSRVQRMKGEARVEGKGVCAEAEITSVVADRAAMK
jgi:hypothetical protein